MDEQSLTQYLTENDRELTRVNKAIIKRKLNFQLVDIKKKKLYFDFYNQHTLISNASGYFANKNIVLLLVTS